VNENSEGKLGTRYTFGPFELMPERQLLLRHGVPVRIGNRALDLLSTFVKRPGELISKRDLIQFAWPDSLVVDDNLKVNIVSLRRALGDLTGSPTYILTVPGTGYRFIAPVVSSTGHENDQEPGVSVRIGNLPTGAAVLYGRAVECDAVLRDLQHSQLVTVSGAGGVGKTSLAIAVARAYAELTDIDVWMVDFSSLRDPALVSAAISEAIGLRASGAYVLDTLCEKLRSRTILLLLDNCEHLLDAVVSCADRLMTSAKGAKILATSREPLGLVGERVHTLEGLPIPHESSNLTAEQARTYPAIQLFVERAAERVESFELCDEDVGAVVEICRRLDGLALAIELAASRIDAFGVSGLLAQLGNRFRILAGRRAGPMRHQTMSAALDWSYGLLHEADEKLLCAVSIFARSFDAHAAATVSGITREHAAHGLARLAAKSLVVADYQGISVIYRVLETTRAFCLQRLSAQSRGHDVQRRHAQYVLTVLSDSAAEWGNLSAQEWTARYAHIIDDLRAALAWASADRSDPLLFVQMTALATVLWNHLSLTSEGCAAVSRALTMLDDTNLRGTETEMKLQTFFANALMFTRGPGKDVYAALERAMQISANLGSLDFYSRNQWLMVGHEILTGDLRAAEHRIRSFLATARTDAPSSVDAGHTMLALIEFYLGNVRGAIELIEPRLGSLESAGEEKRMARFHIQTTTRGGVSLGMYHWVAGRPDTAAKTAEVLVSEALQIGHGLTVITALVMSACPVSIWCNYRSDAERYVAMLDQYLDQHGLEVWRPVSLYFRGALACMGQTGSGTAIEMLSEAVGQMDAIQHRIRSPYFVATLAEALHRVGRVPEASAVIASALERAHTQEEAWCLPELLRINAGILAARNRLDDAEALLVRSIRLANESGALSWQLRSSNDLARMWLAKRRHRAASGLLRKVYGQFTEGHETGDLRASKEIIDSLD
jgi:predicted ATPase/DNA-binding winged helix-turn-helix (wHTH) protein